MMNKRDKELKKRMLYKKTINNMKKYVQTLETQTKGYVEKAKEAKLSGSTSQYSLAINGLKMALAYQKKAKEMLLNFELTIQMKDLSVITGEFLNGMVGLSKDMSKIIDKQNFSKVQKNFEKAMYKTEEQNLMMDTFLDSSQMSFDNISADPNTIAEEEINKLIDVQASNDENNLDKDLDEKIKNIEDMMSNM